MCHAPWKYSEWEPDTIQATAAALFKKLHAATVADAEPIDNPEDEPADMPLSMTDALDKELQSFMLPAAAVDHQEEHLLQEFCLYDANKVRSATLECLYHDLKTIRPTSCEADRAFSASALFATKLRARMSDDLLDALCFLKWHFLSL